MTTIPAAQDNVRSSAWRFRYFAEIFDRPPVRSFDETFAGDGAFATYMRTSPSAAAFRDALRSIVAVNHDWERAWWDEFGADLLMLFPLPQPPQRPLSRSLPQPPPRRRGAGRPKDSATGLGVERGRLRQRQALMLRNQGLSYVKIGKRFNPPASRRTVRRWVEAARRRAAEDGAPSNG